MSSMSNLKDELSKAVKTIVAIRAEGKKSQHVRSK